MPQNIKNFYDLNAWKKAKDLFFLKEKEFKDMFSLSEEVNKLINGLVRSIENQK